MAIGPTFHIENDNPTIDTDKLVKLKMVVTQELILSLLGFSSEKDGGPAIGSMWLDPTRGMLAMTLVAPRDREIYCAGERVYFLEIPEGQEMPEFTPPHLYKEKT